MKIFTIGIGTAEGDLLPLGKDGFVKDRSGQVVKSRLNEDTLKDIALTTGGAYVQGLGPSLGLDQVFRDHIATMERREVASTLERRYEERFQIPLALALLLLAAEAFMPLRRAAPRARRAWWRRLAPAARQRAAAALVLLCLPGLVGWLDPPGDRAAEGNRLYDAGKYDEAASKYGEGLIDAPASPLLQFNLAAALYKQGKYDEAIAALTKAAASGEPQWLAPPTTTWATRTTASARTPRRAIHRRRSRATRKRWRATSAAWWPTRPTPTPSSTTSSSPASSRSSRSGSRSSRSNSRTSRTKSSNSRSKSRNSRIRGNNSNNPRTATARPRWRAGTAGPAATAQRAAAAL